MVDGREKQRAEIVGRDDFGKLLLIDHWGITGGHQPSTNL
jgi:hypothetical protein